jgi:enoyl-[acyl-carrier-protein] reductase (NADH)
MLTLPRRPATVQETAELAAFLLSDRARCMAGDTVNASCGLAVA